MRLTVIGAGNMASAITTGIVKKGVMPAENITVTDLAEEKRRTIAQLGVRTMADNIMAAQDADMILLAVKPHIYPIVLEELSQLPDVDKKIFITIAPGFSIKCVKQSLGCDAKVVRTMPNTPAAIGEGMTALCYGYPVTEKEYQIVETLFQAVGKTERMSEKLVGEVTSCSGSGPAYVYMMIEAMADGAVYDGIPRDAAYKLAAQTVMGAAKMVLESGKHPARLKDEVCSPGGTTIRAVQVLEEEGFRSSIMKAMIACNEKARGM